MNHDFREHVIKASYEVFGKLNHFTAHHYLILTPEERQEYLVEDGQFLVQLWVEGNKRTFKIFHHENDPFRWTTNSSDVIIDRESVEVIGSIIDEHYF